MNRYVPGVGWVNQAQYYALICFKIIASILIVLTGFGAFAWSLCILIYIKNATTMPSILFSLGVFGCLGLAYSVMGLVDHFLGICYKEIADVIKKGK